MAAALRRRALCFGVALGSLLLAAPSVLAENPELLLDRIEFDENAAHAPLSSGGLAKLTLDLEFQRDVERLLRLAHPARGGVVVLDVRTSKVRVFAEYTSGPPGSVLLGANAPAASVFKLVTTAALLEKTPVSPDQTVCTRGGQGSIELEHLAPPSEGKALCAPFKAALGHSRNAVFAQLAARHLDPQTLTSAAERMGFNQPLLFDVPIPFGSFRAPADRLGLARAAAGFTGSQLSVLGGAQLAHVIASGGKIHHLRIVEEAPGYEGPRGGKIARRALRRRTAYWLTRMMERTVSGGTSLSAFSDEQGHSYFDGIRVAGKTGTLRPESEALTTSWFVGFAPSRNPKVVVSVLLQNGTVWRRRANELARDVLRLYFGKRGLSDVGDPIADALAQKPPTLQPSSRAR